MDRARALIALLALGACLDVRHDVDVEDVAGLERARVARVVRVRSADDVVAAVRRAAADGMGIAIAGARHSQGGHSSAPGQLTIDTTRMDRVVAIDPERKTIRVQAGATWRTVQDAAHAHGLAVKVQQSSNVFTVGGSLGVNCHGRDISYGPIISTVESIRLVAPDGALRDVSRERHPGLFALAIGGFGLFGVITDATLSLTDNEVYEKTATELTADRYPAWFDANVRDRADVGLHFARFQVRKWGPGRRPVKGFLRTMIAYSYAVSDERPAGVFGLATDEPAILGRIFDAARRSEDGKGRRWEAERDLARTREVVCRNNAMRPPVRFLLAYRSPDDTDILQEYFVPPARFGAFVDALRATVRRHDVNLLNVTVRYVRANDEAFLGYARGERFALALYVNVGRDRAALAAARAWTRELVDAVLAAGGTYYLPYQRWPTGAQLRRAYPRFDAFLAEKTRYDPADRFTNTFYAHYRGPAQPTTAIPGAR